MADNIHSDIIINVDTSVGIAEIKNLQRQISSLNSQLMQSGAAQAKSAQNIQRNLLNNINATGDFSARVKTIANTTETFTTRLEKNKLGMGEYFRYAGGASKTFGKLFKSEFDTIEKVARERVKTLQTQYIKLGRDANGALKSISVRPLALDMENLATKTAMAAQKQQLMNQLLKQGSTNLLNFGKNTQWAGRQLMVGFSIPLAMLGTAAAKTFMQMEEQAIRFKRVYGESFTSTAETDKMISQVKTLANEFTKYGVAVEKTMQMAADAAAMGKQGSELLAQVNQATRLAVLGGVEQEQALETTISLTNAFGIAADKLSGKIDFLNAVENQTVTSIEDLTIAVPKAGPVIQQLGGDVEDLAFFLTAMKEGGINASEGANALKSGLAALINPTGKASEMLGGLGVNIKGIVEANKGDVKGTVIGFAKALDTLDPLNRARAIEQLFGKFQFARLSTLFQNVIAEGSQASRVLKLSNSTAAELAILSERELKRVQDSPMYKFQKVVEDVKVALVPLGEAFLKAVIPIGEFIKGFLDKFNSMGDGAKQFAVIATTVIAGIGPILLMTFGLIANGAANLIKMFIGIGKIFNGTGRSSQTLGSQTEYLTQQQLEASAVAASLDQTHSRLIQTFSSEAKAVNNLATAYARAVISQAKLRGIDLTAPGAGVTGTSSRKASKKAPIKLRTGIVSVPGPKGAGDIIPAMLAPGESVIPAKMTKKYGGLISGMVNDNLPGFNDGVVNLGGRSEIPFNFDSDTVLESSHMAPAAKNSSGSEVFNKKDAMARYNQEVDKLIASGTYVDAGLTLDDVETGRRLGIKAIDEHKVDKIRLYANKLGLAEKVINQLFANKDTRASAKTVLSRLSAQPSGLFGSGILGLLPDNSAVSDTTSKRYVLDLEDSLKRSLAARGNDKITEDDLHQMYRDAEDEAESKIKSKTEKATIKRINEFARFNTTLGLIPSTGTGSGTRKSTIIANPQKRLKDLRPKIAEMFGFKDNYLEQTSVYLPRELKTRATALRSGLDKQSRMILNKQLIAASVANKDRQSRFLEYEKLMSVWEQDPKVAESLKINASNDQPRKKKATSIPDRSQNPAPQTQQVSASLARVLANGESLNLPRAKTTQNKKAGMIARLFGRRMRFGGKAKRTTQSKLLSALIDSSTVSTRMPSEHLLGMLGKGDTRYRSAFETGTGADYLTKYGTPNKNQARERRMMEKDAMGIAWDAPASERPTYGSVSLKNPVMRALAKMFGGTTGKQFANVANPLSDSLDIYGDTSLIGKRSLGKRSSIFGNDILKSYAGNTPHWTYRKQQGMELPPMYGGKDFGVASGNLETVLSRKFGSSGNGSMIGGVQSKWTNPGIPYIESYTKGGFDLKEISKIISKNPDAVPLIRAALKDQGIKIPVRGQRTGLMAKIFGFRDGVVSVPGPKGAGDVVPAMLSPGESVIPTKMSERYAPLISRMIDGNIPGYAKGKKGKRQGFNFGADYGPIAREEYVPAPVIPDAGKAFGGSSIKKALADLATRMVGSVTSGIKDSKLSTQVKQSFSGFGARFKEELASTKQEYAERQSAQPGFGARFKEEYSATRKEYSDRQAAKQNAKMQKKYGESYSAAGMTTRADGKMAYAAGTEVNGQKVGGRLVSQDALSQVRAARDEELASEKKALKQQKREISARRSGRIAQSGMGLSMAVGMATAVPGAVGEAAANVVGPISAATAAMSLIPGPWGLAAGVIAGAGVAAFQAHEKFQAFRAEVMKTASTMSSGMKAMKSLSEFAGVASPSEILAKMRQDESSPYNIKTGKNTFGGSYLQSEQGQGLVTGVRKTSIQSGRGVAVSDVATQLAQAIQTNVLTKEQAASIAMNLGAELKDHDFSANVLATITKLVGPGGEDITNKPLEVAARIIQEKQSSLGSTENAGSIKSIISDTSNKIGLDLGRGNSTEVAAAEAKYAQGYKDMLDMGQQNLDNLELQHRQRIETLTAAKDLVGIEKENKQYLVEKGKLQKSNADALKTEYQYLEDLQFNGDGLTAASANQILENIKKSSKDQFEGQDSAIKDSANKTVDNFAGASSILSVAQRATLVAGIKIENVDDYTKLQQLFPLNQTNAPIYKKIAEVSIKYGQGAQDQLTKLGGFFGQTDAGKKNYEVFIDYVSNAADGQQILDDVTEITRVTSELNGGKPIDMGQLIDTTGKPTEKLNKIRQGIKGVADAIKKNGGKAVKLKYDAEFFTSGFALTKAQTDYFNSLPADQQKVYTTTYLTIEKTVDDAAIANWRKEQNLKGGTTGNWAASLTNDQVRQQIAGEAAQSDTEAVTDKDVKEPKDTTDTSGGAEKAEDPINSILARLKMVRDAGINASGGIKELQRALGKTGNSVQAFAGLEQNLFKKENVTSEFMDYYDGLDEKAKASLVKIVGRGKNAVATLKPLGKQILDSLREDSIGTYQSGLVKQKADLENSAKAFQMLKDAGMSAKDALEVSRDASLANAIATKANSGEVLGLVDAYKQLANAQTAADKFQKTFDEAAAAWNAKKNKLEIDFKVNTKSLQQSVTDAENEIASKTNSAGGLDDLQAGLTQIGWVEDEINKKYDLREEALDKIATLNDKIAASQKSQLTLADALSRGDISAAASAVQDQRAQNAQDAIQSQRDLLSNSRKLEIDGVFSSVNGVKMSRKDIEEKILKIEKEIFDIEEKRLEPARESIRLKEVEKATALKSLEDQELEWQKLENNIALAATAGWDYVSALKAAAELSAQAVKDASAKKSTPVASPVLDAVTAQGGTVKDATQATKAIQSAVDSKMFTNVSNAVLAIKQQVLNNRATVAQLNKDGVKNNTARENALIRIVTQDNEDIMNEYGMKFAKGGMVPKYFARGGFARGTDTVPAMLTPGEFVVKKYAVENFGVDKLKAINSGTYSGDSVYNYELNVSMSGSNLSPDDVARTVMAQIKQIDSQRLRGNTF